jgi:hypothetical protein
VSRCIRNPATYFFELVRACASSIEQKSCKNWKVTWNPTKAEFDSTDKKLQKLQKLQKVAESTPFECLFGGNFFAFSLFHLKKQKSPQVVGLFPDVGAFRGWGCDFQVFFEVAGTSRSGAEVKLRDQRRGVCILPDC